MKWTAAAFLNTLNTLLPSPPARTRGAGGDIHLQPPGGGGYGGHPGVAVELDCAAAVVQYDVAACAGGSSSSGAQQGGGSDGTAGRGLRSLTTTATTARGSRFRTTLN